MSAMSPHVQQTSVAFTSDRNMYFKLVNNLDEGSVDGEPSWRYLWCIHKAVAVWRIIDQWCMLLLIIGDIRLCVWLSARGSDVLTCRSPPWVLAGRAGGGEGGGGGGGGSRLTPTPGSV